jgi:hypothetical protein
MYGTKEYAYLFLYLGLILSHIIIAIILFYDGMFGALGFLCILNICMIIALIVLNKLGKKLKTDNPNEEYI